jgi:hypothetical protein
MMETKPTIKLNRSQFHRNGGTLGMDYFLKSLNNDKEFNIEYHSDFLSVMRGIRASVIYYENKSIYFDLWEYTTPCYTKEVYNRNFDLIIKVQHKDLNLRQFNKYCSRKNMFSNLQDDEKQNFLNKIVPWSFFPSRVLRSYIGKEESLQDKVSVKSDGFFCGKPWKCRNSMIKHLEGEGIEILKSDQGLDSGKKLTDEEYLNKMLKSKYGIILGGRSTALTDCKNRREIDYMMMKKPILLNYKPHYYNKLEEGKHYIYIDENTDFKNLENLYNIKEIAENGYKWYLENASIEAIPKTFKQIMKEKFKD